MKTSIGLVVWTSGAIGIAMLAVTFIAASTRPDFLNVGLTVAAVLLGGSVVGQWVSFVRRHRAEALQAVDDTSDGQPQRKAH